MKTWLYTGGHHVPVTAAKESVEGGQNYCTVTVAPKKVVATKT